MRVAGAERKVDRRHLSYLHGLMLAGGLASGAMTRAATGSDDDLSYLLPLFDALAPWVGANGPAQLPSVQPGSSIAADDAPLGSWRVSILANSAFSAGVMHVHALAKLIMMAKVVDPYSPWTLLRGALEDFSTSAWLLGGSRDERRQRALSLWHEDFRNREQYEQDTGKRPTGPNAKTGAQRCEQVKRLADSLGLRLQKPVAGDIISAAAGYANLDPRLTRASWRVASGFAHGRYWPNLNATEPRGVAPMRDGYMVALVLDDAKFEPLAAACKTIFEYASARYRARSMAV